MRLMVDRIEDNGIAVCFDEGMEMLSIPVAILPDGVREGSVLSLNSEYDFVLELHEEKAKRHENFMLAESLFDE